MKTLKKTLCLVLAVVMVVGALILPASAADATAKVEYNEEAVELLKGMKILQGKTDGVLDLDSNVTRAEAATFMARLVATPAFMEKFSNKSIPFADCGENVDWAKTYIAYCYAQGILSGTSATTFEPTRGVTGHEMAKMLLCAMGYKADKEGFTGDTFQTNVEILAFKTGINDGVDDLSKPLTRGQVVTMIYNTLLTDMVKYDADGNVETQKGKTLYSETFKGESYTGLITDNKATGDTATVVYKAVEENGETTFYAAQHESFAKETGLDLVGHVVTVYYSGETVYTIVDKSTEVEVTTKLTKADDIKAKFGANVVTNSTKNAWSFTNYEATWQDDGVIGTAAAVGKYIIYNNKIVAQINPVSYTLDKITGIDATKGTVTLYNGGSSALELGNNATTDVVDEYEGMAKDQYVVYYKTGSIYHFSKAQKVTGKLEGFDTAKLTINQTTYTKITDGNKSDLTDQTLNFTDDFDIYIAPDASKTYFVAAKVKTEEPSTPDEVDVYVVAAYEIAPTPGVKDEYGQTPDGAESKYYVQALDMEGNILKREISKAAYTTGVFKEYSVESDKNYKKVGKLMSIEAGTGDDKDYFIFGTAKGVQEVTLTAGLASTAVKIKDNHYFSNVKFIYVDGELGTLDPVVKTGVQALNTSTSVTYIATPVSEDAGNCTVSVVFVKGKADKVTPKEENKTEYKEVVFAWESDKVTAQAPYTNEKGDKVAAYVHTVFIDGVQTEILAKGEDALKGFYTIKSKTDRFYELVDVEASGDDNLIIGSENTGVSVKNMYNGMISLDGATPAVTDVPVTGATLINVSGKTQVPTNAAELSELDTVCMVVTLTNGVVTGIKTIYVVDTTRPEA